MTCMVDRCGMEILRRSNMKRHLALKHQRISNDWEKYVTYIVKDLPNVTVPHLGSSIQFITHPSMYCPPDDDVFQIK